MARVYGAGSRGNGITATGVTEDEGASGDSAVESGIATSASELGTDFPDIILGGTDSGVINPATVAGGSDTGTGTGKRRGRKPGSKNGSTSRSAQSKTTETLGKLLYSLHMMGAGFLNIQELALDREESAELAAAVKEVTDLYEIPLMSEKAYAWVNLGTTMAKVYGTRIAAYNINQKSKKPKPGPTIIDAHKVAVN